MTDLLIQRMKLLGPFCSGGIGQATDGEGIGFFPRTDRGRHACRGRLVSQAERQ